MNTISIMKKFNLANFKPVKKDKLITSIRLESDLLENVDKISAKNNISRNEFIVQCIKYAIKNM